MPAHANLGKAFEADIEAANDAYQRMGLAHVDHNKNEWVTTSSARWQTFAPEMRATTGNGRCLIMVKSNVDFAGGAGRVSVAFDAKETSAASIPLKNFKPEQIARLIEKERCGVRAGFLVRFSRDMSVYWVGARKVREMYDKAMYQAKGKGTHPKSLSQEWLAEHGTLVEAGVNSIRVDYLRAVAPEVFVR